MDLPEINQENIRQAGELATSFAQSYFGKQLFKLIGKRYQDVNNREQKQLDTTDEVDKALKLAQVEAEVNMLKFKTELDKSEMLEAYIKRSGSRLISEQIRKDYNIDSAISFTAEELSNNRESGVSDTTNNADVKEDWFTRWTLIVENISEEEVQRMWAKVLAGEIKQPGRYSLRTLEVLKNLSKEESDTFIKIADIVVGNANGLDFCLLGHGPEYNTQGMGGVTVDELFLSDDAGFIQVLSNSTISYHFESRQMDENDKFLNSAIFLHANHLFKISTLGNKIEKFDLGSTILTKVGRELLQMLNITISKEVIQYMQSKLEEVSGVTTGCTVEMSIVKPNSILAQIDLDNYNQANFIKFNLD